MESPIEVTEGVDGWNTIIFLYNSALKEVGTKLEILNDEFLQVHNYNPIEHIKSRIKSAESIVKKLKRNGYEVSIDSMVKHLSDIAGIRIICSFTPDIYTIAEMISNQSDVRVLQIISLRRSQTAIKVIISSYRFQFSCPTARWKPKSRFRSGPSLWTSGQALNIKFTTNSKATHQSISVQI